MAAADAATVRGDFADSTFTHFGVTSRFFRRDGGFFVNTEGADGRYADFEIRYTFGIEPLQQYLIELPGGRLQALSIAWDTRPAAQGGQRWFHLYPDERIPPGDPLHWTRPAQNWNFMCAECHSTDLHKNYDGAAAVYHTTWSEISVGCEACHGPGGEHVERARGAAKQGSHGYKAEDLRVDFNAGDAHFQVDQCARCHSRRHRVSADDVRGQRLLDDFMPETLREDLYFADGQILDEVYVYGSFLQSRMYRAGVRCSDCHDPHRATLHVEGNALCTRCHGPEPDSRFATLASREYDTPEHHFHRQGSAAAECVACHMPARTYMVVDPRRDHGFRVPRPDLSARLGTPNACNGCHVERSVQWAQDSIASHFGDTRRRGDHFADVIAAGRAGQPQARAPLLELVRAGEEPAIVVATALELIARYAPARDELVVAEIARDSPHGLVRAKVAGLAERYPPQLRLDLLAPLLQDRLRGVRTEAARALASVPSQALSAAQRTALAAALAQYRETQQALADMPAAHLNLAVLDAATGELDRAEEGYRRALNMDPDFLPARFNLVTLLNARGRNEAALGVLEAGIERSPDEGELHYSKGLLLAEMDRLGAAAESLGTAATLMPGRARVRYNHALALQRLGRLFEADVALNQAYAAAPEDADIVNALTIFYAQQGQWARALPFAEKLVALVPDAPAARRLLADVRRRLAAQSGG